MSSHLIHRNLRPPVLTITKCIGVPQLGQIGRGGFFGMLLTLKTRESSAHCHRIAAEDRPMMELL
jgi:hypothetical protein